VSKIFAFGFEPDDRSPAACPPRQVVALPAGAPGILVDWDGCSIVEVDLVSMPGVREVTFTPTLPREGAPGTMGIAVRQAGEVEEGEGL
jgi:hypothetical protein